MKRRLMENRGIGTLKTKLDEVANIYCALLMLLESAVHKLDMKDIYQNFRERDIKITEAVLPLGEQIKMAEGYHERLVLLQEEIYKLKKLNFKVFQEWMTLEKG